MTGTKLVSLRRALQLRLIFSATVPLLLIGLVTLGVLHRQLTASVLHSNSLLAQVAGQQANEVFQDPRVALQLLAALQIDAAGKPDSAPDAHFAQTLASVPFFEALYLVDRGGRIVQAGLPAKFAARRDAFPGFGLSGQAHYRETLDRGTANWSAPFLSVFSGDYAIAISLPVPGGALVGICGLNRLQGLVTDLGAGGAFQAVILDRAGGVIYHSQPAQARQQPPLGQLEPVRAARQDQFGTFSYQWDGATWLGSTAPIPETGWLLLIAQPEASAFAPLRQTFGLFLGGLTLALLLAAGVAAAVANRMTRPLAQLQQQAEAFAAGAEGLPLTPQPWRELAALGNSLKRMVATVAERETELARSQAHYRLLFDAGTDAIFISRPRREGIPGNFVEVNQEACAWLGMSREELLAQSPRSIDAEISEDPARSLKAVEELRRAGTARFETILRGRNGRLIPVEISSRRFDLDGAPAILSLARDITERRRDQAELLRAHQLISSIVETSPVAIIVIDRDALVVTWNPAAERIFGWSAAEIVGRPLPLIPPALRDEARERFVAELAGHSQPQRDLQRLHKSGRLVEVRTASAPLRDAQGEIVGVIGLFSDITAEKHAERELRKLALAVEQSPASVVITDLGGRIEYVNPSFTRLTGYTLLEARGQNPRILKSDLTPPETFTDLWRTLGAGKVWEGEFCNRRKDGGLFWEKATIAPMTDDQGRVTHYVGVKEDISERRKLEEQLRVAQRLEALGTLSGGIAHDFNNLLTAITGYGSLLEFKLAGEPRLQAMAKQILDTAERGASLTRSLLVLTRREATVSIPFDLNERLRKLHELLTRVIRSNIELKLELAAEPLIVNGDASQFDQVIINLTTNARDAMPAGGILAIRTERVELDDEFVRSRGFGRPGTHLLVSVADSGAGIEPGLQGRVFDPFFTTKEVGKGTGLGLAICYGIIQQHHGHIELDSDPGRGTTFRIYLPAAPQQVPPAAPQQVPPALAGSGQSLLLIEDNEAVRQSLGAVLEEYGYRVVAAANGRAGLDRLAEAPREFALVLTDIIMPGLNGLEVGEQIRQRHPDLPVLYLSGYTGEVLGENFPAAAGIEIIAKPVRPRDLLERIHARLNP